MSNHLSFCFLRNKKRVPQEFHSLVTLFDFLYKKIKCDRVLTLVAFDFTTQLIIKHIGVGGSFRN